MGTIDLRDALLLYDKLLGVSYMVVSMALLSTSSGSVDFTISARERRTIPAGIMAAHSSGTSSACLTGAEWSVMD